MAATIEVDLEALPELSTKKFYPLYWNEDRYLVLMGGGGSGKSVFAAQKIIVRMLSEQKHKFLVLRKVAVSLRESVFAELKGVITRWGLDSLFKINESDMRIRCVNGNQIIFRGLDDVEKLKSIFGITGVWIEEASEVTTQDFRQLDIRLRGHTLNYKQMLITFNPIDVNHWLKKEFFDRKKPGSTTVHSTYLDNPFLDDAARQVLEDFKETDPYFYDVYALGNWGVLGKTVFNPKRLMELSQHTRVGKRYRIDVYPEVGSSKKRCVFVEDEQGDLLVFREPDPNGHYCIGADVAEGLPNGDYSASYVIDAFTGDDVAVLHGHIDDDTFGWMLDGLGRRYNEAVLGVEINNIGHSVMNVLLNYAVYPNLYYHDNYNAEVGENESKPGWPTTTITRPIMVAEMIIIVRDGLCRISDIELINEMKTFVKNKNGKPQAQGKGKADGAHDDRVMAWGIAQQMRLRRPPRVREIIVKSDRMDMTDLANAY